MNRRVRQTFRIVAILAVALAAYMIQVPAAPFDGQPLRYRVTDKGFVVSSVGTAGNKWKTEIAWTCEPEW